MRVLAVDWSGKLKRAAEFLWMADVRDGRLFDLRNGLTREQLVARLVDLAEEKPKNCGGSRLRLLLPALVV